MSNSFACMHGYTLFICVCASVRLGDRKAESDSEWRTNPFGRTAESNTKYQNLIISIIIFIIFIHFLPAMLNAVCSSLSPPSPHCSFLCTLIYFFFPSLHCSLHWRHVNLPVMLIDSTQVAYGKAAHFFPFFSVRRCAGDAGALSGNPIYCRFSGQKGLPLTLTDSSQICSPQRRDFL